MDPLGSGFLGTGGWELQPVTAPRRLLLAVGEGADPLTAAADGE